MANNTVISTTEESVEERHFDGVVVDDTQLSALASAEEIVTCSSEDTDRSSSNSSTDHDTSVALHDQHVQSLSTSVDSLRLDAVTLNKENVSSIESGLGGEAGVSPLPSDPAEDRQKCLDAILRRTFMKRGDGVDIVRKVYGRLFDEDDISACIIKFLSGYDRMIVMVDCESNDIGEIKKEVVDWDGNNIDGSLFISFCDLQSETVYLAAKEGPSDVEKSVRSSLVCSLSQVSLKLVFDNEGRPYHNGDIQHECEWMRALEEVKEKTYRGGKLYWRTSDFLSQKTEWARLCCVAAMVPSIIAYHGSTKGRAILQDEYPLLFSVYSSSVMPALQAKAREDV